MKYRRLFESAKDGILILDAVDGSILEINPFLIELLGRSKDDCLGKKLWDIGFFNNIDVSKKLFAELQASGYVRYEDIPLKTKDGRAVQVEFVSNVYAVGGGSVIQCNIRDITERKRADDNLCRLASVVESLDDCVMSVSPDGAIETWNPACERVFGYAAKEIVGKPVATLCPDALLEEQARIMARVREGTNLRQHETIRIAKNGKPIDVSMSLSVLKDSQGTSTGHSTVIRDITANKHLEAKLRQSQKMEGIGRLAGGIAHDFNNLLTAILGYSELLLLSLAPNDAHRADVEQISKAGARAETLTRQLLAFSRQQVVAAKVLDLNAAIQELDMMLRRIIGEHIVLTFLPGRDLGRVKLALGQIEQIVMNLCVNAKDAMPGGGRLLIETKNVEPSASFDQSAPRPKEGPRVMIAVSDTGCGMTPEILSHLYEPYFTTKEKGKGTGLGLSMVYGIVEQNGGNIEVYSEPGHGTAFKIYFPQVGEPLVPVAVFPAVAASLSGSETLLLVEDDEMVRKFAVRVLREAGYLILVASSPTEAVRIVGEHAGEIRVMLTDVVMPGMLGYELVQRVAPLKPNMKIIYMSGYTEQSIVERALLKGAQFIQKPMGREVLLQEIRKALDASRTPA
ncbi:MAG: PAS domain S-box protein [Elusimicrobia bacterium]|nr:PAS domain S-box protein [Elusimicrobiota bacterium]